jgi:hypothetical protein
MIFNIVWGSIWFVGCALLAILNRRLFQWSEKRRKGIKYYHIAKTDWNIKQAFRLYDLWLIITTIMYALFAFNSGLYLYKHVSFIADLLLPDILQTIFSFYGQYLWPVFMFVFAIIIIYLIIKGAKNDWFLLPIWVVNNTGQSLKIYMRKWFIGMVEPGKSIQNNYLHPLYKSYLIEAKDDHENILYSREFSRHDLVETDGQVEINNQ